MMMMVVVVVMVVMVVMVVSPSAVYCCQVSVGQFKSPNRVLWESAEFLFAQAQAIQFVFPRTCDVEFHVFFPFSSLCLDNRVVHLWWSSHERVLQPTLTPGTLREPGVIASLKALPGAVRNRSDRVTSLPKALSHCRGTCEKLPFSHANSVVKISWQGKLKSTQVLPGYFLLGSPGRSTRRSACYLGNRA